HTPDGKDTKVEAKKLKEIASDKLVIPVDQKTAGCWSVQVAVGTKTSEKKEFLIAPSPTLTDATKEIKLKENKPQQQKNRIVVTGDNMIEVTDCKGKKLELTFQVVKVKDGHEGAGIKLTPRPGSSPKEWTFDIPAKVLENGTTWKVKLLLDGNEVKGSQPV